jgi:hypothetical protein
MTKPILVIIADYSRNEPELQKSEYNSTNKSYLEAGYSVLHIIASDQVSTPSEYRISDFHRVVKRPNLGYDFGSWAHSLKYEVDLLKFEHLVFTNSSLIGPLHDPSSFLESLLELNGDVKAAVESAQISPHFQSYLWAIDPEKLFTTDIKEFLMSFLDAPINRDEAIAKGELRFPEILKNLGFVYDSLFPAGSLCSLDKNPSLEAPFRLIVNGFPYIKKSLLESKFLTDSFRADLTRFAPNFDWSLER